MVQSKLSTEVVRLSAAYRRIIIAADNQVTIYIIILDKFSKKYFERLEIGADNRTTSVHIIIKECHRGGDVEEMLRRC